MNTSQFIRSALAHELPHPFGDELATLNSLKSDKMLGHEAERAKKLRLFDQAFRVENQAYKSASMTENWPVAADIAARVLKAAQAVSAGAIILLFLAVGSSAQQTLPQEMTDPAINENLLYLDQQIRTLTETESDGLTLAELEASSPTLTGKWTMFKTTFTYLTADYDNGTINECMAGSTMTLTCSGLYNLRYIFNGNASIAGNSAFPIARILLDGANIDGYGASKSMSIAGNTGSTSAGKASSHFNYRGQSLCSAGSHSVCLVFTAEGGTAAVHSLQCATLGKCYFEATETP